MKAHIFSARRSFFCVIAVSLFFLFTSASFSQERFFWNRNLSDTDIIDLMNGFIPDGQYHFSLFEMSHYLNVIDYFVDVLREDTDRRIKQERARVEEVARDYSFYDNYPEQAKQFAVEKIEGEVLQIERDFERSVTPYESEKRQIFAQEPYSGILNEYVKKPEGWKGPWVEMKLYKILAGLYDCFYYLSNPSEEQKDNLVKALKGKSNGDRNAGKRALAIMKSALKSYCRRNGC